MRVCLLTSEFPPIVGGIASHVFELARALVAQQTEVTVVHPLGLGTALGPIDLPGVRVLRPKLIKSQPFYTAYLRRWIAREAAASRFDLVHVHGVRPLAATRDLPIPVLFTNHSSGFLARLKASAARRKRTSDLLNHVDYLLAPSHELIEAAQVFGYAGPHEMIANGVDEAKFAPAPSGLRKLWGIGANERVLLLARRLVEKNGVVWFARAVSLMGHLPFRVVVAGDGPDRESMTAIFREAGLQDRVLFLGSIANAEMPSVYNAADIAVLPSLAEATSITGLEAMASGLPLVGTRVGGIPTLIEEGVTGLLVPPRDPEAMAQALERLLQAPDLCRTLGMAGRRSVESQFTWSRIASRTRTAYEFCLDQAPAAKRV